MKLLIWSLLFVGFLLLFLKLRALDRMAEALRKKRGDMDAASRQRSLADRQSLLSLQKKHSLWYSLEQKLTYSGLRTRFPGLTAEWWILGNLVAAAVLFPAVSLAGGMKTAAAAVLTCFSLEWYVLKKLRELNLRRTERNLTRLLDFLGNYSVAAGEITGIFSQISRYMEEPVRSALDTCFYEAMTSGDAGTALLAMAERVEHVKFKELARNMEISIRYCADFSAMVESSRRSLREYLRAAQERKGMRREAMINLALLGGMSAAVLFMVGRLTGIDMVFLLTKTLIGQAGLGILILTFALFWSRVHKAG